MGKALFIEPPMDEAGVAGWVTSDELAEARRFVREGRRREYLTWRAIVRRELGADVRIAYDAAGAPVVDRDGVYVGVSHCRGRVAVCLSDVPCAVDIEPETRDFSRAAPRYMSPSELALSGDPLLPAAVWCAKEALYKYARRPGLDLLHDLRVEAVDLRLEPLSGASAAGRRSGSRCIVPTGLSRYIRYSSGGITAWESPSRGGAFPYVSCSRGAGS